MFNPTKDRDNHISCTGAGAAPMRRAAKNALPPPKWVYNRGSLRPRKGAHVDSITRLGKSLIHHGPYNNRIFLYHLDLADLPGIIDRLSTLAEDRDYSRIFARIPASAHDHFIESGYVTGAHLPGLFHGRVDGYYMAKYIDPIEEGDDGTISKVLSVAQDKAGKNEVSASIDPEFSVVPATPRDAPALTSIYREVFETYPVPIHDPDYLARAMQESLRCFCILEPDDHIVSVAAAEVDPHAQFAEMTGFATLPDYRGHGFASYLLRQVEGEMRSLGVRTTFAVARACSYPANITFARAGYTYAGTLDDSVNICGSIEDMNIWYRSLTGRDTGPLLS